MSTGGVLITPDKNAQGAASTILRYLFAALSVAGALGLRYLLLPLTGAGAPFLLFFSSVLASAYFWGFGPGLFAGSLSAPLGGYLFVYEADYPAVEAVLQSSVFIVEMSVVSFVASRVAIAKRQSERSERAARNAEAELVVKQSELQSALMNLKKLQQLREEWISVVAHDLQQPLSVIVITASTLLARQAGVATAKEGANVERIRTAALNLSRMVNDLLDLSRLEADRLALERSWGDIRPVVEESIKQLALLTAGVRVTVVETGDICPVFIDAGRVSQVVENLLSNAVKHGAKDGEIRVEIDRRDDGIEVSVTNQGPGISPADLPHLFNRFSRSDLSRRAGTPGLGLGLYIAKGLVEAHGGRIWAESVPGQTTFHFTLPSWRQKAAA